MGEVTQGPQLPDGETGFPSDHETEHGTAAVHSLKQAMRRARFDDAERAGVMSDLRAAKLARLEILQEALQPLVVQIPPDVDMFDMGLMPGMNPRLFIDMIGFIEIGRDHRIYCFYQDRRHGRTRIAESPEVGVIVEAVTDYVARRLLERDKALAADGNAEPREDGGGTQPKQRFRQQLVTPPSQVKLATGDPVKSHGVARWGALGFAFLIDLLGSITFFTILAFVGWMLWNGLHKPE